MGRRHFKEDEARNKAKRAKKNYEAAIRNTCSNSDERSRQTRTGEPRLAGESAPATRVSIQ